MSGEARDPRLKEFMERMEAARRLDEVEDARRTEEIRRQANPLWEKRRSALAKMRSRTSDSRPGSAAGDALTGFAPGALGMGPGGLLTGEYSDRAVTDNLSESDCCSTRAAVRSAKPFKVVP